MRKFVAAITLMAAVFVIGTVGSNGLVWGQAKGKAAKAAEAEPEAAVPPPDDAVLKGQAFGDGGLDLASDALVEDKDKTAEGRQRLRELEGIARTIYLAKKEIDRERGPLAAQRDALFVQSSQALVTFRQAEQAALNSRKTIANCNQRLPAAQGNIATNLRNQKAAAERDFAAAEFTAGNASATIQKNEPVIQALSVQIKPYDDRLRQLSNELAECRKQWLEIRQPVDKYARGDFERLRKVLDDWLLVDGLWPQAFCWAGLCAYEMGEYADAMDYLEKAEKLRVEYFRIVKQWPELCALNGLVARKLPGQQSVKANKALEETLKLMDKKADHEAYFLLARAYADKPDDLRAKAFYENALEIRPNYVCAQLGLARLQTVSKNAKVRDEVAGLKALERLWKKTGKQSWRIAYFLVEAYDAAGRYEEADKMMAFIRESDASPDQKDKVNADRRKAREGTKKS